MYKAIRSFLVRLHFFKTISETYLYFEPYCLAFFLAAYTYKVDIVTIVIFRSTYRDKINQNGSVFDRNKTIRK